MNILFILLLIVGIFAGGIILFYMAAVIVGVLTYIGIMLFIVPVSFIINLFKSK